MTGSLRRRDFIWLAAAPAVAAAWSVSGRAPERMRLVATLSSLPLSDPELQARLAIYKDRLKELGWVEDRNVRFEVRATGGDAATRQSRARELVAMRSDVLIAGSTPDTAALLRETRTIPIVFTTVADPVGSGFVRSLAHPGGNVTGFTNNHPALGSKWLELLREIAPRTARIAVVFNPQTTSNGGKSFLTELQAAAAAMALEVAAAPVASLGEIEEIVAAVATRRPAVASSVAGAIDGAVAAIGAGPADGLLILPDSFTVIHRAAIVALATRHRIPAIYPFHYFVDAGGLISYGVSLEEPARQAAAYADLILRGADPGELPVQSPRKYDLIINIRAANELGLKVSPALLVRADRVIE
jgi:putative ABC transport system substrate-binding protein